MTKNPILIWLRHDLRLADHRALTAAVETGAPVLLAFVLDDQAAGNWKRGSASRWWLHMSLSSLGATLAAMGTPLILRHGRTGEQLGKLAAEVGAGSVYFTRGYEPWAIRLENQVKDQLEKTGIGVKRFSGSLLKEPEAIRTQTGQPYKVYTPFWRAVVNSGPPSRPLKAPYAIKSIDTKLATDRLADWKLMPTKPDWSGGLRDAWQPGEAGANARLKRFLSSALPAYTDDRNRPDLEGTSRLSPHLQFGEISPNQCWHAAQSKAESLKGKADRGLETFHKELVWREFAYTLLVHWPDLPEAPFRKEFAAYPWATNTKHLRAWQKGQTGYPIVDAGMRELWGSGWMHNRVRMIVASFLIKHLQISWQEGAHWFWDTLVDADLASNSASWQWVAGSGADAAPYFRIFNPITQGEKFDPDGHYIRRWVPELSKLPNDYLNAPWTAPKPLLDNAGVVLGKSYPQPLVVHDVARKRALDGYELVKKANLANAE
jgi:deoxyribodipyrimidine photo-lyase